MAHDLLLSVLYVIGLGVIALGVIGIVAQVRFEWLKRRAHRDIDRVLKERGRR